ncbi:MAG TPA: MarR family winged helix-turn-helix transcriptional regulator [Paucimonas sp.]|nr:MarR family winged helix-turn-helix transcriptional regulator [Paucimonas sp.]
MSAASDNADPSIENRIAAGLACIAKAMRAKAWEQSMANGLTPTQADILALLAARGTALRLSVVVEQLAVSAATASEAVTSLVNKALVEKARAKDDGRAIALKLTRAGAKLAAEIADWSGFLSNAVEPLTEDEKVIVLRSMVKMIRHLQERNEIPTARMCISCKYFEPHRHADSKAPHHCRFVNAPIGDQDLRIDCAEHEAADADVAQRNWMVFIR